MKIRVSVLLKNICAAALCGAANTALAHEKWFHDSQAFPLRWDLFFSFIPLLVVALVGLTSLLAFLWQRQRNGQGFLPPIETFGAKPEHRAALYGLVPAILAIHLAVPLFVMGVQGRYLSDNNVLPFGPSNFVGLLEVTVALSLFYGGLARIAALLLAAVWLQGLLLLGVVPALENMYVLGFAAFFFLAGRGPISIDRLLFPRLEPSVQQMRLAIPVLRLFIGFNLMVLAFTEKLANMPLALAFLEKYPLNFTRGLGLGMSNEVFVLCAGAVELLVGIWIALGIFPREIILVAWLPFNLTLTIFNSVELVGHLPFYGAMAVLLTWQPGEENLRLWLEGLRRGPFPVDTQS